MEFRVIDVPAKRPARFSSYLSASRSRLLALSASAAFMVLPGEMARAQEATAGGAAEEKTASPEAGSNGRAQAGVGADGSDPEGDGASGGRATDSTVPPVIVEQEPDVEPAPPVATAEPGPAPTPRPRPVPRSTASVPPGPSAATADGGFASQEAIEEAIFDLPVDGSTLNRGSSGIDGYYAAGTSSATKTNTLIMNIPGSVSIIPEELAEDQGANTLGQALLYVPGIAVQQGEGHRDQLTFSRSGDDGRLLCRWRARRHRDLPRPLQCSDD